MRQALKTSGAELDQNVKLHCGLAMANKSDSGVYVVHGRFLDYSSVFF